MRECQEHPQLLHPSFSEMTFSGLTFTIFSVPSTFSLIRRLQTRTMTAGICRTLQSRFGSGICEAGMFTWQC